MRKISFLILFSFLLCFICVAQEEITITTYYPSPEGAFRTLRAETVTVTNNNEEIEIGGDDNNAAITLRHLGGGADSGQNPYIAFANDAGEDFRLELQNDNRLNIKGGETYFLEDDGRTPATLKTGAVWYCTSY